MIIGFTGTREGMTPKQRNEVIGTLREYSAGITRAHHGGCVGADEQFHSYCIGAGISGRDRLHVWPGHPYRKPWVDYMQADLEGNYTKHEPAYYLDRNRQFVELCDLIIATPKEDQDPGKGGTWYTIRYAKEIGKQVKIITP